MKIDVNFPSATISSANEQQRGRSTVHHMDPQGSLDAGQVQQDGATARVAATVGVSRTARGSDTTDVSGVTHSITDLATVVHSSADVRSARVAALRDAVSQGTYQVSPDRIAESMLAQATSKLR